MARLGLSYSWVDLVCNIYYLMVKYKNLQNERNEFMQVEREEILHIAKLACLNIKEEEIEEYRKNLQDILNFAETVNNMDTENISETIGSTSNINVFREDEIKEFEDKELLLQNAPEQEDNMFNIPNVI